MNRRLFGNLLGLALLLVLIAPGSPLLAGWLVQPRSLPDAPQQIEAVIDACGNISANTTWTAGNVYTAHNCNVIVDPAATLTIQAGVIVKVGGGTYSSYDGNAAFVVKGTLVAQGTEANPVVFTSWRDDDRGGDTNGDGAGTGSPGEWYGLYFVPNSQGDLTHTHVFYAASGQYGRWDGVSYVNRAQINVYDAALALQNAEVAYSPLSGIALYGAATQAVIESTRVISNTGAANTGCPGGIFQDLRSINAVYHDLTLEDNSRDVVALRSGALTSDVTLDGAPLMSCGSFDVPDGYALTLKPGTHLRFSGYSHYIRVRPGAHLTVTGTLTAPVVFAPAVDDPTGLYWSMGRHPR